MSYAVDSFPRRSETQQTYILKISSCIPRLLPTLLIRYNLLGSGPSIRDLVCIYDTKDDTLCALIVESTHKKVTSVKEVTVLVDAKRGWRIERRAVNFSICGCTDAR